eukprot:Em0012g251a
MLQAVTRFNTQVPPDESITAEEVLVNLPPQRALSKKLDMHAFQSLLSSSSPVNKARILSVSAPHAGSRISVIPSTGLDLHLNSAECQIALRWWLGLDTSGGSLCPHCPDIALEPLGHHAASCRHGGDVVARHNHLWDIFANFCRWAHLSVRVEVGYGLARVHVNSRPADVLVQGWDRGKPATFDVTVASPLTPVTLNNASTSVGAAAYAAERRKQVMKPAGKRLPRPPFPMLHRPADILIAGWDRGKPAALDLTITSPLCSAILSKSCHQAGAAALAAEARKLHSNGPKCQELGWSCIPFAVETYGNWGKEAHDTFSILASYLAIHQSSPKSAVVAEIYGQLNIALVRCSIARAILARELPPS